MIRFVHAYTAVLADDLGNRYIAHAYGEQRPDKLWEGWFVFFPLGGGRPLPTDRETTQSSWHHLCYWTTGVTPTFLEGALERALALQPEARLARRAHHYQWEAERARNEAAVYEQAAADALAHAEEAERRWRQAVGALDDGQHPRGSR